MRRRAVDVERLLNDVEWGIAQGFPARDLVAMLERLVTVTEPGTATGHFARLHLAELLVEAQPWRAAALVRPLAAGNSDHRAWAILGLATTVLGHYWFAARCFRRALRLEPESAAHNHNLGHLLDVALGRPADALVYLRRALDAAPDEPELASSLAHALARTGRRDEAVRMLHRRGALARDEAEALVERWTGAGSGDPCSASTAALRRGG